MAGVHPRPPTTKGPNHSDTNHARLCHDPLTVCDTADYLRERPTIRDLLTGTYTPQPRRGVADGYNYVVDIDLEVRPLEGPRGRAGIRQAGATPGVLEDGLVRPTEEGTPQGGPLSLLSNLVLDELDKELEGHRFCRSNIYVRSLRATVS